jgi:uncharacterized protein (DUF983 family)
MTVEILENPLPQRLIRTALLRGARGLCPNCGHGSLFRAYLKTRDSCQNCGEELHHQRADDAPPYFTIMIVGHIILPLLLIVEKTWRPELWIHAAIWLPMTVFLSLTILPIVKGALVGVQWALHMHGFNPRSDGDLL